MKLITERNPTLTPATAPRRLIDWGRADIKAIYRIHPDVIDGRKTA